MTDNEALYTEVKAKETHTIEKLKCGCLVFYQKDGQIVGSDFCETHIEIFHCMLELTRDEWRRKMEKTINE